MFKKQPARPSARTRQPAGTLNSSFRRNNVVISKRQQQLAQRQQSVTQRQVDLKKHQAHMRIKRRVIVAIVLAFVALLGFRMQITGVQVESNASSRLTSEQKMTYEAVIYQQFKAHSIASQSWLLDSTALTEAIIKENPEIQRITFSSATPFSATLKADIRFRKAVFTWQDASKNNQFVDGEGILFAKNMDPTVNVAKLIKIEDQSGTVLKEGTSVLTANIIAFIGQLHSKITPLYGQGATVAKVIIPRSTREVQLQITGQPYYIKFNSTRSLDEQIGELQSLLGFLKANGIAPSAYIDLRVAHKAFYK